MRTCYMLGLSALLVLSACVPSLAEALAYPVRNGAFERQGGWGRPQQWGWHVVRGEHTYLHATDAPSGNRYIEIRTTSGVARFYQTGIPVLEGSYRLTFRAKAEGAGHVLLAADGVSATLDVPASADWSNYALALDVPNPGPLAIYLHSVGAGTVAYDDVGLEPVRLASGPVPTDGKPLGQIVLPDEPTAAERFAAYELERCIHAMTGVHLALAGRDEVTQGRRVLIGRAAIPRVGSALPSAAEGYVVSTSADTVALAGRTDRATLYAVYHFLRSLGCRWVMPGHDGEVIPRRERLSLPHGRIIQAPDFTVRGFMCSHADFLPDGGWIPSDMDALLDWALRHRFNALWWGGGATEPFGAHRGYSHDQTTTHSYHAWVPLKLFERRPEWFPLVDGKREPLHSSGRPNQLCLSNRHMRQYIARRMISYFESHPQTRVIALNAEDEPACWCECDACKALDRVPVDWSKNGRECFPLTDRVVDFVNDIAARVARKFPDRLIEMYAYGSTTEPPVAARCHPNVLVKYCMWPICGRHGVFYPTCERNRKFVARIKAWRDRCSHLAIYNYGDYNYPEAPACSYTVTATQFAALRRLGVEHVLGETDNSVAQSIAWYTVFGEVLWDTHTDPQRVIADFCTAAYGPAAAPMIEYYRTLESGLMAAVEAQGEENATVNNLEAFSPEVVAKARELLAEASTAAADDDLIQARIDRALFSLLYAETCRISEIGPKTNATFQGGRESFALMKTIQRKRNICSGSPYTQARLKGFYVPPLAAQDGKLLAALPVVWKFREDPSDVGITEDWQSTEPGEDWSDIRTDASWTDQGHPYHGVAWYSTEFDVPVFAPGRRAWLLFGAVDGTCEVWIDGKPAGKQTDDPGLMWDKPFALDVTALVAQPGRHRVTVRVRKDNFAAGIWKPVELRLEAGGTST